MQGSPLGGKSSLVGGVVVQGLGGFTHREPETPRDTHGYPETPTDIHKQNQQLLPCLYSRWEMAAASLPCGVLGIMELLP